MGIMVGARSGIGGMPVGVLDRRRGLNGPAGADCRRNGGWGRVSEETVEAMERAPRVVVVVVLCGDA